MTDWYTSLEAFPDEPKRELREPWDRLFAPSKPGVFQFFAGVMPKTCAVLKEKFDAPRLKFREVERSPKLVESLGVSRKLYVIEFVAKSKNVELLGVLHDSASYELAADEDWDNFEPGVVEFFKFGTDFWIKDAITGEIQEECAMPQSGEDGLYFEDFCDEFDVEKEAKKAIKTDTIFCVICDELGENFVFYDKERREFSYGRGLPLVHVQRLDNASELFDSYIAHILVGSPTSTFPFDQYIGRNRDTKK
jgi:hypothetical protein